MNIILANDIDTGFTVSLEPRDETQARQALLAACETETFAERASRLEPTSNGWAVVPSAALVEAALLLYRNVAQRTTEYETNHHRVIRVSLSDLERGQAQEEEFRISTTTLDDGELALEQAAETRELVRRLGCQLLPADMVADAMERAKQTLLERSWVSVAREAMRLREAFKRLGVTSEQLRVYTHGPVSHRRREALVRLWQLAATVRELRWSWDEVLASPPVLEPRARMRPRPPKGPEVLAAFGSDAAGAPPGIPATTDDTVAEPPDQAPRPADIEHSDSVVRERLGLRRDVWGLLRPETRSMLRAACRASANA